MVYYSSCEADTFMLGEAVGRISEKDEVYCLTGDLGAGKTVFAKGFARGLGVDSSITSPTFTLLNEYQGRLPFYHFDAYRLQNADASACFDFAEYFSCGGVCLIEWADKIANTLPANAVFIKIERDDEGESQRIITVTPAKTD